MKPRKYKVVLLGIDEPDSDTSQPRQRTRRISTTALLASAGRYSWKVYTAVGCVAVGILVLLMTFGGRL